MPDVKVRQVALSDQPAELVFSVPIDEHGRQNHELGSVAQSFSGAVESFQVQCITLDSERLEDVGFLKIDVEQHERQVLRGALDTISRCRPVVLIEVYPLKYEQPLRDEFEFVLRMQYAAWFCFAGRWMPMERFDAATHAAAAHFGSPDKFMGNNLIFFPQEHPLAAVGPQGLG